MYIDPKPLHVIAYKDQEYIRTSGLSWLIRTKYGFEWIELNHALELEEAYQSNNQQ